MGILLCGQAIVAGVVLPAVGGEDGFQFTGRAGARRSQGGAGEAEGGVIAVVPASGGEAAALLGPAGDGAVGGVAVVVGGEDAAVGKAMLNAGEAVVVIGGFVGKLDAMVAAFVFVNVIDALVVGSFIKN